MTRENPFATDEGTICLAYPTARTEARSEPPRRNGRVTAEAARRASEEARAASEEARREREAGQAVARLNRDRLEALASSILDGGPTGTGFTTDGVFRYDDPRSGVIDMSGHGRMVLGNVALHAAVLDGSIDPTTLTNASPTDAMRILRATMGMDTRAAAELVSPSVRAVELIDSRLMAEAIRSLPRLGRIDYKEAARALRERDAKRRARGFDLENTGSDPAGVVIAAARIGDESQIRLFRLASDAAAWRRSLARQSTGARDDADADAVADEFFSRPGNAFRTERKRLE